MPTRPDERVLIINNGLLGGLVATWAECAPGLGGSPGDEPRAVLWFGPDNRPSRGKRLEAVRRQAHLCGLRLPGAMSERGCVRVESTDGPPESMSEGLRTTAMLVSALVEAASLGIGRVIWPAHAGAAEKLDADRLADTCDRALLAAQLVSIDLGRGTPLAESGLVVQTPYADLNDTQLLELALDLDAPLNACWWCLNEDVRPCGHCSSCMRWREALTRVDPSQVLPQDTLGAGSLGVEARR